MGNGLIKLVLAAATLLLTVSTANAGFSNRGVVPPALERACPVDFAAIGGDVRPSGPHLAQDVGLPPALMQSEKVVLEHKVFDSRRLLQATNVLELDGVASDRLRQLRSGNYIYVIDSKKRLAWIPRVLDPGNVDLEATSSTFLGSHEALLRFLREFHGDPNVELVAAGEITMRDSHVMMMSNGAGTYKGATENLDFARSELQTHGLPMDSQTKYWDYSTKKYPDPHSGAVAQARTEILASRDPAYASLQRTVRAVMRKVWLKFPGEADLTRAVMKIKDRDVKDTLFNSISATAQWYAPQENEAHIITHLIQTYGRRAFPDGSPRQIKEAGEGHVRFLMRQLELFTDKAPAPVTVSPPPP